MQYLYEKQTLEECSHSFRLLWRQWLTITGNDTFCSIFQLSRFQFKLYYKINQSLLRIKSLMTQSLLIIKKEGLLRTVTENLNS